METLRRRLRWPRYEELRRGDWVRVIAYIAIFIFVGVITTASFLLLPNYFHIWLILVIGGLVLFVRWHVRNFAYRCQKCGHKFEISTITYFISPHGPGWKYLKCPKCHRRSKATKIRIKA